MKLIFISDTHCQLEKVDIPEGDILCHSGDLSYRGNPKEIFEELNKLAKLKTKFKHIILICGNHDWLGQRNPLIMQQWCEDFKLHYLQDSFIVLEGIKFYGSPWQPEFCNWAFNLQRGEALKKKWELIPEDTHVLLTHGPPKGILDTIQDTYYDYNGNFRKVNKQLGCEDLMDRVNQLKQLKVHSFGHLHLEGGNSIIKNNVTYINAAICDENYRPVNKPIIYNA